MSDSKISVKLGTVWYWLLKWSERVLLLLIVVLLSAAPKFIGYNGDDSTISRIAKRGAAWGPFVALWAPIALGFVKLFKRESKHPMVQKKMQRLLDHYQRQLFPGKRADQHRITLYEFRQYAVGYRRPFYETFMGGILWVKGLIWPQHRRPYHWWGTGWMVPIVRSGETTKNHMPLWICPDESAGFEGVASYYRVYGSSNSFPNLPDLNKTTVSEKDINNYASQSYAPLWWVKKRVDYNKKSKNNAMTPKTFPRFLGGTPVNAANKVWGSLVVDSVDPEMPENCVEILDRLAFEIPLIIEG